MKKIFKVDQSSNSIHIALLIARVFIAGLMLSHGIPKLMMLFSGEPIQFPSVMSMSSEVSLCLAVLTEVLCSVFILVGFATRFASIPLIITMIIAVFVFHGADPFSKKELGLQYLLMFVVLLFAGSGKYSLDYLIVRNK